MQGPVLLVAVWLWLAILYQPSFQYEIDEWWYYEPVSRKKAMQCAGGNIGGEINSNNTKECCEELQLTCIHNMFGRNAFNKTVDDNLNKTVKDMLTCCQKMGGIQLSFVKSGYDIPGCIWWNQG